MLVLMSLSGLTLTVKMLIAKSQAYFLLSLEIKG